MADKPKSHGEEHSKSTDSIASLERKIRAARERQGLETPEQDAEPPADMGAGWRIASELLTAVVVLTALGWGIDYIADTTPWFMIVFLFVGAAVGVNNAVRTMNRIDKQLMDRQEKAKQEKKATQEK